MQIREQGKQVQLIRSIYDPTKKRCNQSVFCHFPRRYAYLSASLTDYLSAEQIELLSADEAKLLSDWLKTKSDKNLSDDREFRIRLADSTIDLLADAISSAGLTEDSATKIYESIDRLKKAIKKSGFSKKRKCVSGGQSDATIPGM